MGSILHTLLVLGVSVSGATVASEPLPAVTTNRNAVVGFALTVDLITNSVARECSTLATFKLTAPFLRTEWKGRNFALVEAAHQYLMFVKARVAQQQSTQAADDFYNAQKADSIKNAQGALDEMFPTGHPDLERCQKMLNAIERRTFDFSSQPDRLKELEEIRKEMATIQSK